MTVTPLSTMLEEMVPVFLNGCMRLPLIGGPRPKIPSSSRLQVVSMVATRTVVIKIIFSTTLQNLIIPSIWPIFRTILKVIMDSVKPEVNRLGHGAFNNLTKPLTNPPHNNNLH
jgi:hypothetical protein